MLAVYLLKQLAYTVLNVCNRCKIFMKKITTLVIACSVLSLSGCTGLFESKTCGIRNSQWERMSTAEQLDVERSFHEKQRLAEQLKLNKITAKHQAKLAKERAKNAKAQAQRLAAERETLEKQKSEIELDLERKQQAYLHRESTPE